MDMKTVLVGVGCFLVGAVVGVAATTSAANLYVGEDGVIRSAN